MKPLDRFRTIKAKLSSVIVFAVGITIVAMVILVRYALARSGQQWWQIAIAGIAAAVIGLGLARVLAIGLTKPLRDMAAAARRTARGDYSSRIRVTSRDEVGQLADAFNRMAEALEHVERERRALIANVSHELGTPIAALQAHLENLLDGVEEPNRDVLATMLQQSRRLGRLVEQLLDLSRLESGEIPLRIESADLSELADDVISEVALTCKERDISLINEIPAGTRTIVDAERIHQVLYNLLDNGVRFSPEGARIEIGVGRENGAIVVSVADEGPGIPSDQLARVFERFYRVDPSRARSDGGTGIGLAIARSVVEAHGGRIWAENRDKGSIFRFSLPAADDS